MNEKLVLLKKNDEKALSDLNELLVGCGSIEIKNIVPASDGDVYVVLENCPCPENEKKSDSPDDFLCVGNTFFVYDDNSVQAVNDLLKKGYRVRRIHVLSEDGAANVILEGNPSAAEGGAPAEHMEKIVRPQSVDIPYFEKLLSMGCNIKEMYSFAEGTDFCYVVLEGYTAEMDKIEGKS